MSVRGTPPRTVVVIGAAMAGLLAAAALARDGRTVTVLDRDDLPEIPAPRRGVPQGRQPHLLLHRGLRAVEDLLPGFTEELRAAGGVAVDTGDLAWLASSGWAPRARQLDVVLATRPLLEHLLRVRVAALPGVRVVGGARATGLRRGARDGPRWWVEVAGDAGGTRDAAGHAWPADLVVDASGRSSRLPVWLDVLGVAPAAVEEVDAQVGYATVRVRLPADRVGAAGVVVLQQRGHGGGLALPAEGGWWTVTAVGAGEQRPPRDLPGLRAFLAALPDDSLARIAAAGPLDGDVVTYRQTGNRRHRYDRVPRWPDGLVVVGDALCAFDPVYGQGITVAALEAHTLRDADGRGRLTAPGGAARAVRDSLRLGALPWQIATGEDRTLAGLPGPRSPVAALTGTWITELGRMSAHGDVVAQDALSRVYHLVAPPTTLFHPRLVGRALRTRLRGYGPAVPRPVVLPDDAPRGDVPPGGAGHAVGHGPDVGAVGDGR